LGDRDRLLLLAESIADGARIDWAAVDEQADAADEAVTRQLRIVAKLAALHRTLPNGRQSADGRTSNCSRASPAARSAMSTALGIRSSNARSH